MKIQRHRLSELGDEERAKIVARSQNEIPPDVARSVEEIVEDVRNRGDEALVELSERIDGVRLEASEIRVRAEEIESAGDRLDSEVREALDLALGRIEEHHRHQLVQRDWTHSAADGTQTGERWNPIPRVGLYVPRGKGTFPSVTAMLCVPARVAGVPSPVICTPPAKGGIDPASLYVAHRSGVEEIHQVGGAQAIAAMALGTGSITKVDKILGPGNLYVTGAKRHLYGEVDPGPPSGPSESLVLADASADPGTVAVELLVEAEHGPDSAALLVTDSDELADAVAGLIPDLVDSLPEPRSGWVKTVLSGRGGIVVCDSLGDAVDFCNEWAPEHLRVIAEDEDGLLEQLVNVGEVLLGRHSSIALGNYLVGVNAILPTGGAARSHSCLGVHDFMKRSSFARIDANGAARLSAAAATLADYEGFPMHSIAARRSAEHGG